jgi:hypothetical protein
VKISTIDLKLDDQPVLHTWTQSGRLVTVNYQAPLLIRGIHRVEVRVEDYPGNVLEVVLPLYVR